MNSSHGTISLERRKLMDVINTIKTLVDEKKVIEVGAGAEQVIGVKRHTMRIAVNQLREQGYKQYYVSVKQAGTNLRTTIKVLSVPGTTFIQALAAVRRMGR
jgi:hypothetical protein